jgi:Cu(I)/Ag(I) efflux system membrane fusion protein
MKKYKIFQNNWIKPLMWVAGGLILGWLVFHNSEPARNAEGTVVQEHNHDEEAGQIWTCTMHPQIRMDKPGNCPICGMELIPVQSATASLDPNVVRMTEEAIRLAEVQTIVIGRENAEKEVSLYGKVKADERRIKTQASHVPGRIEELLVSFTGETVSRGQVIARIYSPSLVIAQEELLQARQLVPAQPALIEAAREKLRQWKLTSEQIAVIEQGRKMDVVSDVIANVSGIVLTKRVNQGDYVQQGAPLFEVADLSRVWVLFDAYESDLPWIKTGNKVTFTLQSLPGQKFSGTITFIDPVVNPETRVALVRVEASNPGGMLKPEMFVNGTVTAALPKYKNGLVIPQSAVLWTGQRSVVYVKVPGAADPEFSMREIELGPALSEAYVVLSGLKEGEEIVTLGAFSVDAAAQLEGKASMMNPQGGKTTSMPEMVMPGDNAKSTDISKPERDGRKAAEKPVKISVNMDFTMQLNTVFEKYIVLKDAFMQGDVKKAQQAAEKMENSLSSIDMKLLTGNAHTLWMNITVNLDNQLKQIASAGDIEKLRMAFSELSIEFYNALKSFNLMGKTVYYQFCPMAFDEKGAFWLSTTKEIRNPYYGDQMRSCGEIKEILKY